mmetsp:Transcript_9983/g.23451  ORF Transcript_9983/g.23451 Transcript_9983/m.23451 type:complete len:87 (+) Transcript_9983:106-366(+)
MEPRATNSDSRLEAEKEICRHKNSEKDENSKEITTFCALISEVFCFRLYCVCHAQLGILKQWKKSETIALSIEPKNRLTQIITNES